MKQETLEEDTEKYVEINVAKNVAKLMYKEHFIEGAKWQQEKDKKELLFFGEWIFDQFNLNADIPVSKIIKEYLTIKKLL